MGNLSVRFDLYCPECGKRKDYSAVQYGGPNSQSSSTSVSRRSNISVAPRSQLQNQDKSRDTSSGEPGRRYPRKVTNEEDLAVPPARHKKSPLSNQDFRSTGDATKSRPFSIRARNNIYVLEIALLLAYHEILSSLYMKVLPEIGSERFVIDFVTLLKQFNSDLRESAKTDFKQAISRLLGSRQKRERVAIYIVAVNDYFLTIQDILNRTSPGVVSESDRKITDVSLLEPQLMGHLNSLLDTVQEVDSSSDEQQDDDDEEDGEDRLADLNLSKLNSFVVESNALQNLVTKLSILPLPSSLRPLSRVMITLPSECVWFSAQEDSSLLNRMKALAERMSGASWCWWPLRPRMRLLQKDETRIHWRCVSGLKANLHLQVRIDKRVLALRQASLD